MSCTNELKLEGQGTLKENYNFFHAPVADKRQRGLKKKKPLSQIINSVNLFLQDPIKQIFLLYPKAQYHCIRLKIQRRTPITLENC